MLIYVGNCCTMPCISFWGVLVQAFFIL
uniref:Uncharacterized protein n=1 Tax=Arundo donax TaxID=35708 RepID=A0A0A9HF98_ARUDO